MTVLAGVLIAVLPFATVAALLALARWSERRRAEAYARQIQLTDALHWRVGAAVAPVVRRRLGGAWQVLIPVPFDRPALVETVVGVVRETWAARAGAPAEPFELVLSPRRA
jgi:hypothetical protein